MDGFNLGPEWFWKLLAALALVGVLALAGIIIYLIIYIAK